MLDVVTGDKATQKMDDKAVVKKEASCMVPQPNSDNQYHPILPLVPNSSTGEMRAGKLLFLRLYSLSFRLCLLSFLIISRVL